MSRREWIGVYGRLVSLPKFGRTSDAGKLGLFYTWLLAADTDPEATWPSIEVLSDLLDYHGRPTGVVEELVDRQWLDLAPDGSVTVHDWDEWQFAASTAARRSWEARYMRDWRRRPREPKPLSPAPLSRTGPDQTRPDPTGVDNSSSRVNNGHDRWHGYGEEWRAFEEAWDERFATLPTLRQREALWPIADARPNDLGGWVRSAPRGADPRIVIGHVLKRWGTLRATA